MDPADLWVPAVAVVLVTALAVFAATRRSEPAGPLKRGVAGVATAVRDRVAATAAVAMRFMAISLSKSGTCQ